MDVNLLTFISAIKDIRKIDIGQLLPNLCVEEYGLLKLAKTRLQHTWNQKSITNPDDMKKDLPDNYTKDGLADTPLNPPEASNDSVGYQNTGIKVSSLVKGLNVPASVVSRTLRSLDKKGLITRTVDERDRRNILVWVTPKGKEMVDQADVILEDFIAAVFTDIGEDNIKQFFSTLKKLQNSFKQEIDKRAEQKNI